MKDWTDGILKSVPNEKPVFIDCCPCCGKPLIIKQDGIYYTIEAFDEIDFDNLDFGGDTDERENKERERCVDIV